jgi:hypothetical protein
MRGMVLTELLDFADRSFPGATRQLVLDPCLGDGPSPVASYPQEGLADLVRQLAAITGRPAAELLRRFGTHLFHRFAAIYPVFFRGSRDCVGFLSRVPDDVHGDLRRFHPDAELPELHCSRLGARHLVIEYRSSRSLADLAEGLLQGCIEYFGDDLALSREDLDAADPGQAARFVVREAATAGGALRRG